MHLSEPMKHDDRFMHQRPCPPRVSCTPRMRRLSDSGQYIIGEQLGAGGQGRVFAGRQLDLDRRVAIKQLHDASQIRHEARLLASLRHPNILAVHELIELDGQPALVLEHIDGPDLATLMADVELGEESLEALWLALVQGLAHAHKNGVIHGDLSPSNVMVEIADGQAIPKICDFGVGRSPANPIGASGSTEGFVAPELRSGGAPTLAGDVYSLAALGRFLMPGTSRNPIEEAVALALAPEPSARPVDAMAFADLLGIRGQSHVRSASVGTGEAAGRPGLWLAVMVGMVLVACGLAVVLWPRPQPEIDAHLALAAMQRWTAQPAEAAALWHAAGASVPPQARAIGADSIVLPHPNVVTEVAAAGQHLLTADVGGVVRAYDVSDGRVLWTHETGIRHPHLLSANSELFVMTSHPILGENRDRCIAWALIDRRCIVRLDGSIRQVELGANGEVIWYATLRGETGAYTSRTGEQLWKLDHGRDVRVLGAMREDRPDQVAELANGRVDYVDLRTGQRQIVVEGLDDIVPLNVTWSRDGFRGSTRQTVFTVNELGEFSEIQSAGYHVTETPFGFIHAGGRSRRGTLHTDAGSFPIHHVGWQDPVAWGGPSLLVTSTSTSALSLIDARSGHVQRELVGHSMSLQDFAVVGDWLATSSMDSTVRLWRPRDQESGWLKREATGLSPSLLRVGAEATLLGRFPNDQWAVWTPTRGLQTIGSGDAAHLDPGARMVVVAGSVEGSIVHDVSTGVSRTLNTRGQSARCAQISPDVARVLVSTPATYELFRLSDGQLLEAGSLGDAPAACATLDLDGRVWLTSGPVSVLRTKSGDRQAHAPFEGGIAVARFQPEGLVLLSNDGAVAVGRPGEMRLAASAPFKFSLAQGGSGSTGPILPN